MTPKNSTPNLPIPTHKLITLFTSDEYDNLYKAPQFTDDERSYFLTFSAGDLQLAQSWVIPHNGTKSLVESKICCS